MAMRGAMCVGGPNHGKKIAAHGSVIIVPLRQQMPPTRDWSKDEDIAASTIDIRTVRYEWNDGWWRFEPLTDHQFRTLQAELMSGQVTYRWDENS